MRQKAMHEITDNFMTGVFVPQCTSTGEYKKMQCNGSTGYCWCVDVNGEQVGYDTRNEKSLNCESKRIAQVRILISSSYFYITSTFST